MAGAQKGLGRTITKWISKGECPSFVYWLFLGLLPFLFFSPVLLQGRMLAPGDGFVLELPLRMLLARYLSEPTLPLWNPWLYGGYPLLGSGQAGVFYPSNWLFLFLSPAMAMNLAVVTTYSLAALFMYLYAREAGSSRWGSLVSGVLYPFSGFMMWHLGHTDIISGACWIPLVLFFLERLQKRLSWWDVLGGGGAVAVQFFSGHPQVPVYTLLIGGCYLLFFGLTGPPPVGRSRYLLWGGMTLLSGVLLAAVQLLPTLELGLHSPRQAISFAYFTSHSLPWAQLPMLLFPYLFGGGYSGMPYRGEWNMTELHNYIGILPLMLAGAAVVLLKEHRQVRFWLGLALLALLLSLGGQTPLYRLMFYVPGYNLFKCPGRNALGVDLAVAVVSGLALTHLPRLPAGSLRWAMRVGIGVVGGSAGVIAVPYLVGGEGGFLTHLPSLPGLFHLFSPALFVPLLLTGASAGALHAFFKRGGRLSRAGVLVVVLVDMGVFGQFTEWRFGSPDSIEVFQEPEAVRFLLAKKVGEDPFRVASFFPSWWYGYENYFALNGPNLSSVRGLYSLNGYGSLALDRYLRFVGSRSPEVVLFDNRSLGESRALDLLGAKYLISPTDSKGRELVSVAGVGFTQEAIQAQLSPEHLRLTFAFGGVPATAVGLISCLANSASLSQGQPVARVTLFGQGGEKVETVMVAGQDTAEWAWEAPEVQKVIQHGRAEVAESFTAQAGSGGSFLGHRYFAKLALGARLEVQEIQIDYLAPAGLLEIQKMSLHDATTQRSAPIGAWETFLTNTARWQKLKSANGVDIYENRRVLPRAWLVSQVRSLTAEEVLQAVHRGRFADGTPFDPLKVALVEKGLPLDFGEGDPQARVVLVEYGANSLKLLTHSQSPAFLVTGEVAYPGWQVVIDGQGAAWVRTDYVLRGVVVPAGDHVVTFRYRPLSFWAGAGISLLTLLGLLATAAIRRGEDHYE